MSHPQRKGLGWVGAWASALVWRTEKAESTPGVSKRGLSVERRMEEGQVIRKAGRARRLGRNKVVTRFAPLFEKNGIHRCQKPTEELHGMNGGIPGATQSSAEMQRRAPGTYKV